MLSSIYFWYNWHDYVSFRAPGFFYCTNLFYTQGTSNNMYCWFPSSCLALSKKRYPPIAHTLTHDPPGLLAISSNEWPRAQWLPKIIAIEGLDRRRFARVIASQIWILRMRMRQTGLAVFHVLGTWTWKSTVCRGVWLARLGSDQWQAELWLKESSKYDQ